MDRVDEEQKRGDEAVNKPKNPKHRRFTAKRGRGSTTKAPTAAVYVKSADPQSLMDQISACKAYAARRGLVIGGIFADGDNTTMRASDALVSLANSVQRRTHNVVLVAQMSTLVRDSYIDRLLVQFITLSTDVVEARSGDRWPRHFHRHGLWPVGVRVTMTVASPSNRNGKEG